MFQSITYDEFDDITKSNLYVLRDSCLSKEPIPVAGRPNMPRLQGKEEQYSSAATLLTVISFYERQNRFVPPNLVNYFRYLADLGFYIEPVFINDIFCALEQVHTNCSEYLLPTLKRLNDGGFVGDGYVHWFPTSLSERDKLLFIINNVLRNQIVEKTILTASSLARGSGSNSNAYCEVIQFMKDAIYNPKELTEFCQEAQKRLLKLEPGALWHT